MNKPRYFCNDCVIFATYGLNAKNSGSFDGMNKAKLRVMKEIIALHSANDCERLGL